MKKLTAVAAFLLASSMALGTVWHQIMVPLEGKVLPGYLSGMDVISAKPGYWARLVATDKELAALEQAGVYYQVEIPDLQSHYASMMSADSSFGDYYTFAEANAILDSLHQTYPAIISERMIVPNDDYQDETWLENHVWAVKISDNVDTDEDEPEVLYTGLHHAREPIGVNICVDWARWLCENYGNDPLATYFVDEREIWLIPVINPDGYLYNQEIAPGGGGMHRKNRRPTEGDNKGVDLNRNYPYKWGYDDRGSSPNPESSTYRGPEPGSEPETQSVMNLCREHEFVTALNFHSYSNLFLYPWGYLREKCEDSLPYYGWGEVGTRGGHYAVIAGHELYPTNGDSDDWMYGETEGKNLTFAVTPEVGEAFWQEWQIAEHIAETRPLMIATAKAAGAYPELVDVNFSAGEDADLSPGEEADIWIKVHNMSVRDETGTLELELATDDPRLQVTKPNASIPSLAPQTAGDNSADPLQVMISASAQPDSAIPMMLTITTSSEEFTHKLLLPVGEQEILLADGFENVVSSWTTNWQNTEESAHTGTYCITDSPYTGYGSNRYYYHFSPVIDLSDKVNARVSFWHRFSIEKGFDWGEFLIRHAQTEGWITLKRYSGTQDDWEEEGFDLTEFCGTSDFQIGFVLETDKYVEFDGWYVDDVSLTAYKGVSSFGAISELVDIKPLLGPRQSVATTSLDIAGPNGSIIDVEIYDASGRLLLRTSGKAPLNVDLADSEGSSLPSGTYFVKTVCQDRTDTRKVVVVE